MESTAPQALRLTVLICRLYLIVAAGLGLSTLPLLEPGSLWILAVILVLLAVRRMRGRERALLPDGLLVLLPYAWAMNATGAFKPWWSWLVYLFGLAFSASIATFYLAWLGKPTWRTHGLGMGIGVAFLTFCLASTLLRQIFPLFTLSNYQTVLMSGLLFFGGIPVCQLAAVGIVFPAATPLASSPEPRLP
ncbi:MAG TPA: hypothetical protein VIV61_17625 [Candidatus Ozemobacteraceae bacterium]